MYRQNRQEAFNLLDFIVKVGQKAKESQTSCLSENKPFQNSDDTDLEEEDEYFTKIVCLAYRYLNLIPSECCLQREENMKSNKSKKIKCRKENFHFHYVCHFGVMPKNELCSMQHRCVDETEEMTFI